MQGDCLNQDLRFLDTKYKHLLNFTNILNKKSILFSYTRVATLIQDSQAETLSVYLT